MVALGSIVIFMSLAQLKQDEILFSFEVHAEAHPMMKFSLLGSMGAALR